LLLVLCVGKCAEDINTHLSKEPEQVKGFLVCSSDTLLRMQKELSTSKEISISKINIDHDYNINMSINQLLVKLLIQTKQLVPDSNKGYIFEYDNQFIPTDKYIQNGTIKKLMDIFPVLSPLAISRFMIVPSKWIKHGRQQILKLFTMKKYHLLL